MFEVNEDYSPEFQTIIEKLLVNNVLTVPRTDWDNLFNSEKDYLSGEYLIVTSDEEITIYKNINSTGG